ncbi:MAG: MerR family transcriptional regulator [Knoellia sp.]
MRISELSARTRVPVATLKYYLREELLMRGALTAVSRAEYDGTHVDRVRLIRALIEAGGLSVAAVRTVIHALEQNHDSDVVDRTHAALPVRPAAESELAEVDDLIRALGWQVRLTNPGRPALDRALTATAAAGLDIHEEDLRRYAAAAVEIAEVDLRSTTASPDLAATVRTLVAGTIMVDPVISAMRRLAQEHVALSRPSCD